MKARSLVFDLFGDHLRYRDGTVRLRALVALMACFDVAEPTVRVVAARLRKEGWLDSRRDGRETTYTLTQRAWTLLDEGRTRIFDRAAEPWDSHWYMIIYQVPESARGLREQLRKRLSWLGFGALAPSVWVSPHDRTGAVRDGLDEAVRLDVFHARSAGPAADRDMAGRAWDLAALDRDYAALLADYRPRLAGYRHRLPQGPDALVQQMQLIHGYRLFPFRDPDLPPQLLPPGWSGHAAHEAFRQAHEMLRVPAEAFVDEVLATQAD